MRNSYPDLLLKTFMKPLEEMCMVIIFIIIVTVISICICQDDPRKKAKSEIFDSKYGSKIYSEHCFSL